MGALRPVYYSGVRQLGRYCPPVSESKLIAAIKKRDLNRLRRLLSRDPGVAGATGSSGSPLHAAARAGESYVRLLLEHGAHPDGGDRTTSTPIFHAATAPVARALIEAGADLDIRISGESPLHYAAERARVKVAAVLIEAGVPVGEADEGGYTPLHRSVEQRRAGPPALVRLFLENGAPPSPRDNWGTTPLHLACYPPGIPKLVELLIEFGASVDIRDDSGCRPGDVRRQDVDAEVREMLTRARRRRPGSRPSPQAGKPTALEDQSYLRLCCHPVRAAAVADGEERLVRFDLDTQAKPVVDIALDRSELRGLDVSAKGDCLAVGGPRGLVELRRWKDLSIEGTIELDTGQAVVALRFWPDRRWLVAGAGTEAYLIDLDSGETSARVETEGISSIDIYAPSSLVAIGTGEQGGGYIELYRLADGDLIQVDSIYQGDAFGPIGVDAVVYQSVGFSPRGNRLAGLTDRLECYELPAKDYSEAPFLINEEDDELPTRAKGLWSAKFSLTETEPDGDLLWLSDKRILCGLYDGRRRNGAILEIDARTGRIRKQWAMAEAHGPRAMSRAADGRVWYAGPSGIQRLKIPRGQGGGG